jgi:hypothetical protein
MLGYQKDRHYSNPLLGWIYQNLIPFPQKSNQDIKNMRESVFLKEGDKEMLELVDHSNLKSKKDS